MCKLPFDIKACKGIKNYYTIEEGKIQFSLQQKLYPKVFKKWRKDFVHKINVCNTSEAYSAPFRYFLPIEPAACGGAKNDKQRQKQTYL